MFLTSFNNFTNEYKLYFLVPTLAIFKFLLFSFAFYWSSSWRYSANVAINNTYLWDKKNQAELFFLVKITQILFDFDLDEIRTPNDKWMNLIVKLMSILILRYKNVFKIYLYLIHIQNEVIHKIYKCFCVIKTLFEIIQHEYSSIKQKVNWWYINFNYLMKFKEYIIKRHWNYLTIKMLICLNDWILYTN